MTGTEQLDDLELELRKLPGVRAVGFSDREDVLLVQIHIVPEQLEPGLALQATRIASRYSERQVAVELVRWRTLRVPQPGATSDEHLPASTTPLSATPSSATPLPAAAESAPTIDLTAPSESAAGEAAVPADEAAEQPQPAPSVPDFVAEPQRERRARLLAVLTFPDTDELEVHLTLAGKRAIGRAPASRGLVGAVAATVDAVRVFVPDVGVSPSWARTLESASGEPFLVGVGLQETDAQTSRHGIATGSSPIEAAARASLHALNRTLSRSLTPESA